MNITVGNWPSGYQLDNEIDLAKDLGVSRGSLRKAISLLVNRQLLLQVHGKGTFVKAAVIEQPLASKLVSVSEELLGAGVSFQTQVLEKSIIEAPQKVAEMLDLHANEPVFFLKRVRSIGVDPIVLNESYLPADTFGSLMETDFTLERLFPTLEKTYGIRLSWASRSIAAIRAEPETAQCLHIEMNSPVLYNEQLVYDDQNNKVEFSKGWFPGDRFRLRAIVQRRETDLVNSISLPVI